MSSFRGPVAAIIVAPLLTAVTYSSAVKSAAGQAPEPSGRYQAVKGLIVAAGEYLGPMGSLAVGAVATVLATIWLVHTFRLHKRIGVTSDDAGSAE